MSIQCRNLHQIFRRLPRHKFQNGAFYPAEPLPMNGLYIMFERGETAHGGDRIVRIGTHTTQDRLLARLLQHFVGPSILRKQIGRIYLKDNEKYYPLWNKDKRAQFPLKLLRQTDTYINNHIRNNFSFAVFEELDPARRDGLEKNLVATLAQCDECGASDNWLGHQYPGIALKAGLWNINYLKKKPFTEEDLITFLEVNGLN